MEYTKEFKVEGGLVRGEQLNEQIATFKGIPYAAPPTGNLRFKAPGAVVEWEGVKDCVLFGNSPMQNPVGFNDLWTDEFIIRNRNYSEDCLTLNLWTDTTSTKPMPVIIYFYGGGYVSGGSSCEIYDGLEIAKRGVVFVTFNHREGTLGLFSNPVLSEESDNHASGNYLLMDGIAAIRWVKNNIASFGGDPDNITIMGQSSGAGEVNSLTVSPLTKGLFGKSISMSFNTYNEFARPTFTKEEGYEEGKSLLESAGKTVEDLKSQAAEDFLKDQTIRHLTLDGYVLDKKYKDAVNEGRTGNIITVMGAVPGDNLMSGLFSDSWNSGIKIETMEQVTAEMKKFFLDDYEAVAKIYDVENRSFLDVKKDLDEDFLISSMLYFVEGRIKAGADSPAYIYYYVHPMPGPMAERFGAFHSCEVPYFTNVFSDLRKDYWKEEDFKLGEQVCNALVEFAKTGKPGATGFVPCDGTNYFRIDVKDSKNCIFDEEKRVLWFRGFRNSKRG